MTFILGLQGGNAKGAVGGLMGKYRRAFKKQA